MQVAVRIRNLLNALRSQQKDQESSESFVSGNYQNKYNTKNPIERLLMSAFLRQVFRLFASLEAPPQSVVEVGCGEGEMLRYIRRQFPTAQLAAMDLSAEEIALAEENNRGAGIVFSVQNAEHLEAYEDNQFDLVICLEVLEHLENPEKGLAELIRISRKDILVSVPNEPIWRMLNMLRGKYWKRLGNTPGHLNHWTIVSFPRFLQSHPAVEIITRRYPLPWQMAWLRVKK